MKEIEKSALLEIGAEEIPASYCALAVDYIRSISETTLRSKKLSYKEIQVLGTPRRLSLLIFGLPSRSEVEEEEIWGPPLSKSKDPQGNWTQAALGYAKSQGVDASNCSIRLKKEIQYLCVVKKRTGLPAEKIVQELFKLIIQSIPFPKKMVWDNSGVRFARPIRNLVALVDKEVLRLSVGKVKSTNKTFGLSRLKSKLIPISMAQTYVSTLKNHCILVDPEVRKATLLKASVQLAEKSGGKLQIDEALAEEVTWLVEHPVATLCHFDPKFLSLPSEVLTTCMRKQQKFFSVLDEKGKLTSHFIAIRNGISEHQESVRKGYEKVLTARLSDAEFFLTEDLKKPLEFYLKKSGAIVYQEKLGSVQNKIDRVRQLAKICLDRLKKSSQNGLPEASLVDRTIEISKFDLATQMVYEFPELQGIMGSAYSAHYGASADVSRAIREHAFPLTAQGELPSSSISSLVALADKMDTIVGSFLLGNLPTGNSDPYGLRRHSSGVIRILLENKWEVSLLDLVKRSVEQFPRELWEGKESNLYFKILEFLTDRFQLVLQGNGISLDVIHSVTNNREHSHARELVVTVLNEKITALTKMCSHPDFEAITAAFKRISNILKQAHSKNVPYGTGQFSKELLKEPEELDLYQLILGPGEKSKGFTANHKFTEALNELVSFRSALDHFFTGVMVMAEDKNICSNRLSLLLLLESLFKEIADFSYLQNKVSL